MKCKVTIDNEGLLFIENEEGCVLHSYLDSAGIWTIGWGSTRYNDGTVVGPGEKVTQAQADAMLQFGVNQKTAAISGIFDILNQHQVNACVSLAYNIGSAGFNNSTLCRKIKINPNDPNLLDYFVMWDKITVNGRKVVSAGLLARRKREYKLYSETAPVYKLNKRITKRVIYGSLKFNLKRA